MARSFSTATLTVKIQEGIVLGGRDMGSLNSFSVTGIKNIVKRLMTATTSKAEVLKFDTTEAAGQYIKANVKYIRITNLDDTNHIWVYLTNSDTSTDEVVFKLDSGQSFIYNADSGGVVDSFAIAVDGDADETGATDLTSIEVKADTNSCDIETYIATT